MTANTVLITGANRGLGLEFVKQYARENWLVFACCRQPEQAHDLKALQQKANNIKLYTLDVNAMNDIQKLATTLKGTTIDILIHNAGIYGEDMPIGHKPISIDGLGNTIKTNAIAPLKLTEALLENIIQSQLKKIVYISSKMGSIGDNHSSGAYAYRASKVAGNMVMKNISIDLAPQGVQVFILNPGWVQTDMGGESALITPQQSVNGMRTIINRSDIPSGNFYNYNGEEIPW